MLFALLDAWKALENIGGATDREHRVARRAAGDADSFAEAVADGLGRLQTKLEGVQSKREDIRERLLEARHVVALLEVEERQVSIAVEEVEADLKKMRGYQ